MLGKAFFHASPPDGREPYDLVIFDAPATGHGLDMLRVPKVIQSVAPPGLLRKEADRALELFRDAEQGGAVLVTLPEDMPAHETLELHAALRDELSIPAAALVVNRRLPELFPGDLADAVRELPEKLEDGSAAHTLARAGRMRTLRESVQRESLALLEAIDAPRVELPYLYAPEFGRDEIEKLAETLG